MSEFFEDIFRQNIKVQKSIFMKYVIVIQQCYSMTKASYFIIMYIFIQSEEEYSLIWNRKPLTTQSDKGR